MGRIAMWARIRGSRGLQRPRATRPYLPKFDLGSRDAAKSDVVV